MNRPAIYSRPKKPLTIPVRKRGEVAPLEKIEAREIIAVDRATECHVTPDDLTLEPSAGTGQLARALLSSGHSPCELAMIERHRALAAVLRPIGPTIHGCFLEYAAEAQGKVEFPRIIMNPPFREVRKHMAAALSLLGRGGHDVATLVALVPVTYQHDDAEHLEDLPPGTFSTARVHAKIIRFERF